MDDLQVALAAAEAVRKAHAVGLLRETPDVTALTYPTVKSIMARVRRAGVAERARRRMINDN